MRGRRKNKNALQLNFVVLRMKVSFVPHALTCPLYVDGTQAIKIHISAIDCMILVAASVRRALPPTQPVETLSCRLVKTGECKEWGCVGGHFQAGLAYM